jgi:23S rRNA (uracil747-C5)-methyltransferase
VRCHHFDSGACRSCTLLGLPRPRQLAEGRERVERLLAPHLAPGTAWEAPIVGAEEGFRARGKMAVGGTAAAPVLTLPGQSAGTDLCDCPLYPAGVEAVLEGAKALIRRAQVPPYDVARRRGEVKNVLVTSSPDGEHLLRFVLRSTAALDRLREHLPRLLEAQPSIVSVSANIHPEHTTRVEGAEEIPLAGAGRLAVRTGDVTLFSRPRSFLQTHTEVAGALYRQGADWAREIAAGRDHLRVWDLYCGLGGFALHLARAVPTAELTGVEVSAEAIEGAREGAAHLGLAPSRARFHAADATAWAIAEAAGTAGAPDLVVVNPPRRGLGPELATWLERSGVPDVLYSSCHPGSLADDLAAMPSLRIVAGRYVDMFPHTEHAEVIVRLRRTVPGEEGTP